MTFKNPILKKYILICLFQILILNVFSQETIYSLNTKEFMFDLIITNDSIYELNYMHNWVESGYNNWEKGKVIKSKDKITLISFTPEVSTSTIKIELELFRNELLESDFYFKSDKENWKIISVKNDSFVKKILIKR